MAAFTSKDKITLSFFNDILRFHKDGTISFKRPIDRTFYTAEYALTDMKQPLDNQHSMEVIKNFFLENTATLEQIEILANILRNSKDRMSEFMDEIIENDQPFSGEKYKEIFTDRTDVLSKRKEVLHRFFFRLRLA